MITRFNGAHGAKTDAKKLSRVYEEAATRLSNADLRAFILNQSAWLGAVADAKNLTAFVRRAQRTLLTLLPNVS